METSFIKYIWTLVTYWLCFRLAGINLKFKFGRNNKWGDMKNFKCSIIFAVGYAYIVKSKSDLFPHVWLVRVKGTWRAGNCRRILFIFKIDFILLFIYYLFQSYLFNLIFFFLNFKQLTNVYFYYFSNMLKFLAPTESLWALGW